VKSQISGVVPEVGLELNEVGELLSNFVVEAGEPITESYDVSASNEEAQKILGEANAVAEQHIREKFPELPSGSHRVGESLSH
jgi:division protein CdvB (Snf7/Vps24/ESCRT-III family)